MTLGLIAVNVVIFLFVQRPYDRGLNQARFSYEFAVIPCEVSTGRPLTGDEVTLTLRAGDDTACRKATRAEEERPVFPGKPVYLAIVYSMFLHGSWLHIAGNMLFLWVFGNNIEDRMGPLWFLAFYLLSGLVATGAHVAVQPSSTVPLVGASGAIAAVMGAYLVLFPNVRILTLIVIVFRDVPAKWLLGFWFVLQFFTNPADGVAWVAHVGGFVFGVAVAVLFQNRLRHVPASPAPF
ncbi:MAG: rhomboid family intramembrane serine protease [Acidimicrobiales bacterium]